MSSNSTPQTSESSPCFQNTNNTIEEPDRILLLSISQLLEETIKKNKRKKFKILNDCFFSKMIPKISIYDYLFRIVKYTKINISTLILSIASITSLMRKTKNALSYYNIYKLIIASCLLNSKFHEDYTYSSKFYAKVGGISYKELNILEIEFYKKIDYSLLVSEDMFNNYYEFFQTKAKKLKD